MTRKEYEKLEKVLNEAIKTANAADKEYKQLEEANNYDEVEKKILELKAFGHKNYAEGIHQVLASIGFVHKDMQVLEKSLDK